MLKEVEKSQSSNNRSGVLSRFSSSENSTNCNQKKFADVFPRIKKRRVFKSKSPHFLPFKREAPPELWASNNDVGDWTKRWRSEFHIFIKGSLAFKSYQMNPVEIPFIDHYGNQQIYKPLALLHYWDDDFSPKNRKSLLIDIWSNADIRAQADFLIPAFRQANHFCIRRKLRFKIFRDDFFTSELFSNLKFTRRPLLSNPTEENREIIMKIMKEKRIVNFSELIELFPASDKEHLGRLIFDTWSLVARGNIKTNWNKGFHQDSLIWIK